MLKYMNQTRAILPLVAICIQCLILPTFIVLVATSAYIILSTVLLLLPTAIKATFDPVPSRIVASTWVPRNVRLTICNMILLYQILYLVLFVRTSTHYSPVCTHVSGSTSTSKAGAVPCIPEQKVCWPVGPSMEYATELLSIDHISHFPQTQDFPQCGVTHTCVWASVYPTKNRTFRSLPPRSHFISTITSDVDIKHCKAPFYVLYNVSYTSGTVAERVNPIIDARGTRFAVAGASCAHTTLEMTEDMEAVAIPFTKKPRIVVSSVRFLEEPWYLKTVISSLDRPTHYTGSSSLIICVIAIILPLFFSYYICIIEFHEVIQHSRTTFFLYIQLPTQCVLWTLGGIVGWVGVSLWGIISVYRRPCGSIQLPIFFLIAFVALLSQIVYMLGVVVSLPSHDNMALGWQSTRENINVGNFGLDDFFWRNRTQDTSIFLFYPGFLLCFYALADLCWLCSTRQQIDC